MQSTSKQLHCDWKQKATPYPGKEQTGKMTAASLLLPAVAQKLRLVFLGVNAVISIRHDLRKKKKKKKHMYTMCDAIATSQTPLSGHTRPSTVQGFSRRPDLADTSPAEAPGPCTDTSSLPWSTVVPQRQLWGVSTLKKVKSNAWSYLSTGAKLKGQIWTLLTEPLLPLSLAQKPWVKCTWRPCPLSKVKCITNECLGVRYKVAYNIPDSWKAGAWGTHWL